MIGNEVLGSDSTLVRTHAGTAADPYKLEVDQTHDFNWSGTHEFDDAVFLHGNFFLSASPGSQSITANSQTINIGANLIIRINTGGSLRQDLVLPTTGFSNGQFIMIMNEDAGTARVSTGVLGPNYDITPQRTALFVFNGTVWVGHQY